MKHSFLVLTFLLSSFLIKAQVPLTSVVEHFTNTSCGVCANTNMSIYSAIDAHPGVLHISFHPSSPYPNDFFNLQNMAQNDGRTYFYNVYGSTPRTVVNGLAVPVTMLNSTLNGVVTQTSNFSVELTQVDNGSASFMVEVKVRKVAADTLSSALLYVGVQEDTVYQLTNNGEPVHYNVFRIALTPNGGNLISLPQQVGDSAVFTFQYVSGLSWDETRLHSMAILQRTGKTLLNSARSVNSIAVPTGLSTNEASEAILLVYPNPASNRIYIGQDAEQLQFVNAEGKQVLSLQNVKRMQEISIGALPAGVYRISATSGNEVRYSSLVISK